MIVIPVVSTVKIHQLLGRARRGVLVPPSPLQLVLELHVLFLFCFSSIFLSTAGEVAASDVAAHASFFAFVDEKLPDKFAHHPTTSRRFKKELYAVIRHRWIQQRSPDIRVGDPETKTIVELGCHLGHTSAVLAAAAGAGAPADPVAAQLILIDKEAEHLRAAKQQVSLAFGFASAVGTSKPPRPAPAVLSLKLDSLVADWARLLQAESGNIFLVLIDGSHDEAHVRVDAERALRLRPEWLVFDDLVEPGVRAVVEQLVREEKLECFDLGWARGWTRFYRRGSLPMRRRSGSTGAGEEEDEQRFVADEETQSSTSAGSTLEAQEVLADEFEHFFGGATGGSAGTSFASGGGTNRNISMSVSVLLDAKPLEDGRGERRRPEELARLRKFFVGEDLDHLQATGGPHLQVGDQAEVEEVDEGLTRTRLDGNLTAAELFGEAGDVPGISALARTMIPSRDVAEWNRDYPAPEAVLCRNLHSPRQEDEGGKQGGFNLAEKTFLPPSRSWLLPESGVEAGVRSRPIGVEVPRSVTQIFALLDSNFLQNSKEMIAVKAQLWMYSDGSVSCTMEGLQPKTLLGKYIQDGVLIDEEDVEGGEGRGPRRDPVEVRYRPVILFPPDLDSQAFTLTWNENVVTGQYLHVSYVCVLWDLLVEPIREVLKELV